MPLPIFLEGALDGFSSMPWVWSIARVAPFLVVLYILKIYFGGARNTSERNMHSKVVMMTGGMSGIGAAVAHGLASRGAQLVLLTHHSLSDPFVVDYIMDLRAQTNNELITAEQVDLASLHSIRQFATKWVDNAPPRRLDMVILCADTMTPKGTQIRVSEDQVESNFAINYLANFHLMSILSPALRAQPPDRDVRIIFGTCSSYMAGHIPEAMPIVRLDKNSKPLIAKDPSLAYSTSKLAVMTFASAFQKHLESYDRPDKHPMNAHVVMADPGWSRTPGMRRYLTFGTLKGLVLYLVLWPIWWLVLKSPIQGAQSFLFAAMDPEFGRGEGGKLVKEVKELKVYRDEIHDEKQQEKLWQMTEKAIEALEKEGATRRSKEKKEQEEQGSNNAPANGSAQATGSERQLGSRKSRKANTK